MVNFQEFEGLSQSVNLIGWKNRLLLIGFLSRFSHLVRIRRVLWTDSLWLLKALAILSAESSRLRCFYLVTDRALKLLSN